MDNHCKHDKKKNTNTSPVAINAGGLGIGGLVLVGGALVTAAIVSALAFRSRSQRRSSSENMRNKMSPSPETLSVDAPNKLELMMNTYFPPSEEVVTIQTENIQSLTPDKKHDYGINNEQVHNEDSNEAIIDSKVGEDHENTSVRVDSAFENEEQKHLMQVDEEHVDENSLLSDEGVISIEEYEAVEVTLKDIVAEALKNEDEDEEVHQETVEDNLHDEIIMDNCEGDSSDETGYADQIVPEVVIEEEEEEAVDGQDEIILENCKGDLSNKKGPADQIMREGGQQVMVDHEVASDAKEMQMNQVCETSVVACVKNRLKEAVDYQTAANEDTGHSRLTNNEEKDKETVQKVEELPSVDDEAAEVDDQTDRPLRKLMSKDEITHVEFVKEDEDNEEDVTVKVEPSSGVGSYREEEPTPEAKISNSKIAETVVQVKVEMITEHGLVQKYEIPQVEPVKKDEDNEEDVTVKVEPSSGVGSYSMEEEQTPEAKIGNNKIEETVVQVKVEMITEHELVQKYEIPHIESVKENEENKEDITVKAELSSRAVSSSMEEEPTPETKIGNRKIEETDVQVESVKEDVTEDVTELTPEAMISNHKLKETVVQVKGEMIKDHKLVKKDENPHAEHVKEDEGNEEDVTVKAKLSSGVNFSSVQEELTPEAKISYHKTEENMDESQTILGKNHSDSDDNKVIKEHAFANEPWNLKLMAWFVLISVWCLCHWYSELPFLGLGLVGSLLFILFLFGYRNRATYSVKYE